MIPLLFVAVGGYFIGDALKNKQVFSEGGRVSRLFIPNVRGGWNKNKILKYLKSRGSDSLSTMEYLRL